MSGLACPACGAPAVRAAHFCTACGRSLDAPRPALRRQRELETAKRAVLAIAIVVLGTFAVLLATPLVDELTPAWQIAIELALGAVGLAAARALGPRGPREALGEFAGPRALFVGLAAGVLCFAILWSYATLLNRLAGAEPEPFDRARLPTLILTIAVLPALAEEWLCRGALWAACRRAAGVPVTIAVTAVVFALLHGLGGGFVLELPHRFAAGVVFGVLRARTGSLLPGAVAHFTNNALAVVVG